MTRIQCMVSGLSVRRPSGHAIKSEPVRTQDKIHILIFSMDRERAQKNRATHASRDHNQLTINEASRGEKMPVKGCCGLSSLTQKMDENSAMTGEKERGRGLPTPFSQKMRHVAQQKNPASTKKLKSYDPSQLIAMPYKACTQLRVVATYCNLLQPVAFQIFTTMAAILKTLSILGVTLR